MMADLISRAAAIEAVYYKPINKISSEVLKEVPTIDAIPVEWLKQQFYDNPNSKWAEKCRDVFTVWQEWQMIQKEQEAR